MSIRTISSDGSIIVTPFSRDTVSLRVANETLGSYTTADVNYINNASQEPIEDLTIPVTNGGVYVIEFRSQLSIGNAAHNIKFGMDDGGATATFAKTEWTFADGAGTTLTVLCTSLAATASGGATTAWTSVFMRGLVSFSAGGTLLIMPAQASAGLSTSSVLAYASLKATRIGG